jgi:hypothetical protein
MMCHMSHICNLAITRLPFTSATHFPFLSVAPLQPFAPLPLSCTAPQLCEPNVCIISPPFPPVPPPHHHRHLSIPFASLPSPSSLKRRRRRRRRLQHATHIPKPSPRGRAKNGWFDQLMRKPFLSCCALLLRFFKPLKCAALLPLPPPSPPLLPVCWRVAAPKLTPPLSVFA